MELEAEHPGKLIAQRMKLYKLTQPALAKASGADQGDISRLIAGHIDLTVRMACRIAGALDFNPVGLMARQAEYAVERELKRIKESEE